jgi:hypothetical protein
MLLRCGGAGWSRRPARHRRGVPGGVHRSRNRTVERIVAALDQRGVRCVGLSIDQSPADRPIAVNAEGLCTVDGRQLRVVIITATDRVTRDRYLRWLS